MKLHHYREMMAHFGRPREKFSDGVLPKQKPYTKEMFKKQSDLYLQGYFGTDNKDLYKNNLENVFKKGVEEGVVSEKEALEWIQDRKKIYSTLIEEADKQPAEFPPAYSVEPDINKYYENQLATGGRVGFNEGTKPVLPRDKFVELRIKYKNKTNTEFAKLLDEDWIPAQADSFNKDSVAKRFKDAKHLFPDNFDYKGSHVERALTPEKYISVIGKKEWEKLKNSPKELKNHYEFANLTDEQKADKVEKTRQRNKNLSEKQILDRKEKAIVRRQISKGYSFYKVNKAENLLWNDLLRTAKNKNGYFKFKGDAPVKGKYYNKAATENFVLVDKKGNKFKYSTLLDDITKHSGYKLEDVLRPYKQKEFLAIEGLTKELNKLAGYKPGSSKSVFHTQHIEGIDKNPWKVHLTFGDQNIKESASRKSFNADWKAATYVDENGKIKVRHNDVGKIGDANYRPGAKTAVNRYYKSLGPDIVAQIGKKPKGEIKTLIELLDKTGIKLTETQRITGLNLSAEDTTKLSRTIQSITNKQNSGLNVVDIAKWGRAELSALDDIAGKLPSKALGAFGKILKVAGVAAIPMDFIPIAEARSKGLGANVGLMNLAEIYTNLPGVIWEAGEWVGSKLKGKKHEWKPPYETTFGQKYETQKLKDTPVEVLEENISNLPLSGGYLEKKLGTAPEELKLIDDQTKEALINQMRKEKALADKKEVVTENKPTYGFYADQIKNLKIP